MKIKNNPVSIAILVYSIVVILLAATSFSLSNQNFTLQLLYSSILILFNLILWKFLFDFLKKKHSRKKKVVFYLLFSLKLLVNVYIIYLLVVLLKVSAKVLVGAITLMLICLVFGAYVYTKGQKV